MAKPAKRTRRQTNLNESQPVVTEDELEEIARSLFPEHRPALRKARRERRNRMEESRQRE